MEFIKHQKHFLKNLHNNFRKIRFPVTKLDGCSTCREEIVQGTK